MKIYLQIYSIMWLLAFLKVNSEKGLAVYIIGLLINGAAVYCAFSL